MKIEPDMFWDGAEVYDAAGSEIYPGFVEAMPIPVCPAMALATKDMTIMNWEILFLHSFAPLMELNPGMKPCWRRAKCRCNNPLRRPWQCKCSGRYLCCHQTRWVQGGADGVQKEAAMKCAFGENPKRNYKEKGNSSRMTTAARLRDVLFRAREYEAKLASAGDHIADRPL